MNNPITPSAVNITNNYYFAGSQPVQPTPPDGGGLKNGIMDIVLAVLFTYYQHQNDTAIMAWMFKVLIAAGVAPTTAPGVAFGVIAVIVCAMPGITRWMIKKLF
ncbi:hypothetical protein ACP26C_23800 (plasmid) [Franconibacter helveticus 513]|uniref:hypothetical protein n=1 Tax=Franconibacter TaxID=1649295 RepID=UPI0004676B78|nr:MULTISPECIES: hypothetical protein [Franconibacter]